MIRILSSTALALSLLAAPAIAADMKVKAVEVSADVGSIQNAQAAKYFGNLKSDLEAAISARVADRATTSQSEDGVVISVDVNEVELSNTFQNITNLANTKLEGNVNVFDKENTALQSFTLAVSVEQASAFFPAGTDLHALTLDTPVYYQAMVNAFADAVVKRLDG
ncbi:MAG: hypothetical protein QM656_03750 [Paracoccaceae bacterium]